MEKKGLIVTEETSVLEQIVLEKLGRKAELSKEEQWFYLTKILRVSDEEAEKILHKVASEANHRP